MLCDSWYTRTVALTLVRLCCVTVCTLYNLYRVRLKAHQGTCESAAVGRHGRGQQQFVVAAAVALVVTLMQSLLRG